MKIVTKFGYLLYWDITGAPRHIPGQALFCVNVGNGWNSVWNNCFNYSNYWVKSWVIWINSDFEFKYIRLIIRYWFCSTIYYLGDEIYSGARLQVLATGWVSPIVLRKRSLDGKVGLLTRQGFHLCGAWVSGLQATACALTHIELWRHRDVNPCAVPGQTRGVTSSAAHL